MAWPKINRFIPCTELIIVETVAGDTYIPMDDLVITVIDLLFLSNCMEIMDGNIFYFRCMIFTILDGRTSAISGTFMMQYSISY